jgi:hypothetical protein
MSAAGRGHGPVRRLRCEFPVDRGDVGLHSIAGDVQRRCCIPRPPSSSMALGRPTHRRHGRTKADPHLTKITCANLPRSGRHVTPPRRWVSPVASSSRTAKASNEAARAATQSPSARRESPRRLNVSASAFTEHRRRSAACPVRLDGQPVVARALVGVSGGLGPATTSGARCCPSGAAIA